MASENSYIPERPRSALCNNCRRLEKMLADRLWLSISACPIVILPVDGGSSGHCEAARSACAAFLALRRAGCGAATSGKLANVYYSPVLKARIAGPWPVRRG